MISTEHCKSCQAQDTAHETDSFWQMVTIKRNGRVDPFSAKTICLEHAVELDGCPGIRLTIIK